MNHYSTDVARVACSDGASQVVRHSARAPVLAAPRALALLAIDAHTLPGAVRVKGRRLYERERLRVDDSEGEASAAE